MVKKISLVSYGLTYFVLKHSALTLQSNIPEAGVRISPEEWELDQDFAFTLECDYKRKILTWTWILRWFD